eukprot:CAMPEP_0115853000 /NCGR_PEP_ID=MMETSP0287-20121206/13282_1 /TAXON_ID=412157 /ORGANISM="Chrysochromulina rotalis, Strain UIO044" /LENGTH=274 /DNA_ID=CAMNT_0003307071 /DNA_START=24 /DNA_END=849 /DNA_ORIENTATION=+
MSARPGGHWRLWRSPLLPSCSLMDKHDDFNLVAIGVLNAAHVAWWFGLLSSNTALVALFAADGAYIVADMCWLAFAPACVPARVRITLLLHHALICAALPVASGKPVLMRHLLRTWVVELNSWTHIAARRLRSPRLALLMQWLNKPLFIALRIVAFPLTYAIYASERAALSPALMQSHSPFHVHAPLSAVHLMMYGLMLKWGYSLLLAPTPPDRLSRVAAGSRASSLWKVDSRSQMYEYNCDKSNRVPIGKEELRKGQKKLEPQLEVKSEPLNL